MARGRRSSAVRILVMVVSSAVLGGACGGRTDQSKSGDGDTGAQSACERTCADVAATGCPLEYPGEDCLVDCTLQRGQSGCVSEVDEALHCVVDAGGFVCTDGQAQLSGPAQTACRDELDAWARCGGGTWGGAGSGG